MREKGSVIRKEEVGGWGGDGGGGLVSIRRQYNSPRHCSFHSRFVFSVCLFPAHLHATIL